MIAKYINQLLHEHNCVVIPNFGGFVANYAPATIDTLHSSINPPHKKIVFNKGLSNNDGLLANAIAIDKNISFNQALELINSEVDEIRKKINMGESVLLDHIGALFCDKENNINFAPDHVENFLADAYGLSPVRLTTVKREFVTERLERQFRDRPAVPSEAKKSMAKKYAPLLLILPLAISLYWIPAKTNLLQQAKYNLSSLNIFSSSSNTESVVPSKETIKTKPAVIAAKPVTTSEKPSVAVVSTTNYFIIAGSFSLKENAEKLVSELATKGLSANIIGQNANGFYRVSLQQLNSQEAAETALNSIKTQEPNAWILAE